MIFLMNNPPSYKWQDATFWAFAFALFVALIFPMQDPDVFFYLSLGRHFFENGSFPLQDPFLYTHKDWHILHEWLSYLIFFGAYTLADLAGIYAVKVSLWLGAFAILWRAGKKWKLPESYLVAILIFAALVCSHRFVERASLFSDFLATLMLALFLNPQGPSIKWLIALPFVFLFWVNVHPGFVLGLFLFGLFLICQGRTSNRWQWGSFGVSGLACLANPLGFEGAVYPLTTVFKDEWKLYKILNYEWMPPFQQPFLGAWEVKFMILFLLICGMAVGLRVWRKTPGWLYSLLVFIFYVYLVQSASRFLSTGGLAFGLLIISSMAALGRELKPAWEQRGRQVLAGLCLGLGALMLMQGYPSSAGHRNFKMGFDDRSVPVRAVQFMKEQGIQGRLFNQYDWGAYLIWTLRPEGRLYIHGHIDDPMILARDYHGMNQSLQFFNQQVERYGIRYFLLDKMKLLVNPPPPILEYLKPWKIIYQDETSVLWSKD